MSISVAPRAATALYQRDLASQLQEKLRTLEFLPHWAPRGEKLRGELLIMFSELIAPRLSDATRPLLVVVAGSTGAGKSTLVNSVLGHELTKAGVLRPTTRRPILLHNPQDDDPAGEDLAKEVEMIASEAVPPGLALIDSPDIDSVLAENRERALKVLSGADLWLFVTTPTRYGDAVVWEVLAEASERNVAIAIVLNRTTEQEKRAVRFDLARRLREAKLGTAPLFVLADAGAHQGLLPARDVEAVRRWLGALAGSSHARIVAQRSLRGALTNVQGPLAELASLLEDQDIALKALAEACAGAEDQLRDRARRPWAEIEPDQLLDAWRSHAQTWHLLNASSGERVKISRKDRSTLIAAFSEVREAISAQLMGVGDQQYVLLNSVVAEQVAAVELNQEWERVSRAPEPDLTRIAEWDASASEIASKWHADRANKFLRHQTRAVGAEETAALLEAAAIGIQPAHALASTIFGAGGTEAITELREKLREVQGEITEDVVIGVQKQLVGLLPMRKSGEQLARVARRLEVP